MISNSCQCQAECPPFNLQPSSAWGEIFFSRQSCIESVFSRRHLFLYAEISGACIQCGYNKYICHHLKFTLVQQNHADEMTCELQFSYDHWDDGLRTFHQELETSSSVVISSVRKSLGVSLLPSWRHWSTIWGRDLVLLLIHNMWWRPKVGVTLRQLAL